MTIHFKIGADPEVFVSDRKGNAVSALGLIPGTKEEPHKIPFGAIQVDGLAAEFNIEPVLLQSYSGFEDFNRNIVNVIATLKTTIQEKDSNLKLNFVPTKDFDPEYLKTLPKESLELGCNPDYSAYTLQENPRPEGEDVLFRTAAGHIHIGWGSDIPVSNPQHIEICADFVRRLDATVGLYMTLIDPDSRRRVLYGKAGAFRPKPYGVEYRTPSNVWLTSKERRQTIHDLCNVAIRTMTMQKDSQDVCGYTEEQVQSIIDRGDFFQAKLGLDNLRYVNTKTYQTFQKEFNKRAMTKNVSA